MNTRDEILTRIRSKKRSLHRSNTRQDVPDLVAVFSKALTDAKGEVIRSASLQKALGQFEVLCQHIDAKKIVLNGDSPLDSLGLPAKMPAYEWFLVGKSQGDLRSFCAAADIGITGVDAALALTGSIALSNGPRKSRLTALLPSVHVAFVPVSCLLPDIFDWTTAVQKPLPSSLLLVSGPSKTADIERVLTVGVHGPKRLVVFLYDD